MDHLNVKDIKSELIHSHYLGYEAKKIKEIHLSQRLRWITHVSDNTERSDFFKRLSKRKKSLKELSAAKAKQNQLKVDVSNISSSKDLAVNRRSLETERDIPLSEMIHNNQIRHHRQESQIQLRRTNIMFDVKKSIQKSDLIRNRKMSLPVRYGPVIPPKVHKKSSKQNNEIIASLFTQRLDANHPQVKIRKAIPQRPKSFFYKSNSQILPPKRLKGLHSKTNQNHDFEIKPWQQVQNSQYQIFL